MQKEGADDVEREPNAAHDQNEPGILDALKRDESLNGLEEDADTQCEQEDAIEEGA